MRFNLAEIVATGPREAADTLTKAALARPHVNRAVLRAPSADALRRAIRRKRSRRPQPGAAAFICIGETCSLPVTHPDEIAHRAGMARPVPGA